MNQDDSEAFTLELCHPALDSVLGLVILIVLVERQPTEVAIVQDSLRAHSLVWSRTVKAFPCSACIILHTNVAVLIQGRNSGLWMFQIVVTSA